MTVDPQRENGYTGVANEILEAIQQYKFTLNELKIVMCVWRFTYGFQRKSHAMSLSFFENHTGLSRSKINEALKRLIEYEVVERTEKGSANKTSSYSFNKYYDTWKTEKYKKFASVQVGTSVQIGTSNQIGTGTSVQIGTQERNIKESSSNIDSVIQFYIQNLQTGISSSPYVFESIEEWVNDMSAELVLAAMKVSAKSEKKGFKYSEGILKKWHDAGVKTLDDARKYETSNKPNVNIGTHKKQNKWEPDNSNNPSRHVMTDEERKERMELLGISEEDYE